jgi:hypothetical protein
MILSYNNIELDIYFKTLQPLEFTDLTNAPTDSEIEKETGVKRDVQGEPIDEQTQEQE